MQAIKKEVIKEGKKNATDLWSETVKPVHMKKYAKQAGDAEKIIVFSETGAGKTRFYLNILNYLKKQGVKKEEVKMFIIYPDRPGGLFTLYQLIPEEYLDAECINVLPVNNYEDTVRATATAVKELEEYYKKTGVYGWLVFELMENYWSFSQDYYCRETYGKTIGEYFSHMRGVLSQDKADKKTAYEAFAGPFGGPWVIIKFFHNFNWIDKIKRMPYNVVFTSELRDEDNKDSVFYEMGYRPAGEKHMQHKVDTILYLLHKGNNFFVRPFKLSGYERLYGEINVTKKNVYEEHKKALKRLEELGHKTTKWKELEKSAGVSPPIKKPVKKEEKKPVEKPEDNKDNKEESKQEVDWDF